MSMYAVNTKGMKLSEYTGISLLSLAVLDNTMYAVNTGGLVSRSGITDENSANIDGHVTTGKMRFGDARLKRASRLYVDATASNGLDVTVATLEGGRARSRLYRVPPFIGSLRRRVAKLSRKAESVYWTVKIANINGGTLVVKKPEMLVETLKRRV